MAFVFQSPRLFAAFFDFHVAAYRCYRTAQSATPTPPQRCIGSAAREWGDQEWFRRRLEADGSRLQIPVVGREGGCWGKAESACIAGWARERGGEGEARPVLPRACTTCTPGRRLCAGH